MPFHDRRAAGRRRAWGRGPIILKLESLERRALMAANASANSTLPDLANSSLTVSSNVSDWNGTVEVEGQVTNQGHSTETAPFQVALYASPVRGVDKFAVPIGEVTIPAGLAPGQSVPYQTSVQLPSTPLPNVTYAVGGVALIVNGVTIGGLGVSGAPGGQLDDDCARAAIAKIQDRMK